MRPCFIFGDEDVSCFVMFGDEDPVSHYMTLFTAVFGNWESFWFACFGYSLSCRARALMFASHYNKASSALSRQGHVVASTSTLRGAARAQHCANSHCTPHTKREPHGRFATDLA